MNPAQNARARNLQSVLNAGQNTSIFLLTEEDFANGNVLLAFFKAPHLLAVLVILHALPVLDLSLLTVQNASLVSHYQPSLKALVRLHAVQASIYTTLNASVRSISQLRLPFFMLILFWPQQ